MPAWLKQQDLDYCVAEFRRSGFHGGLNYYRNFDRNWELLAGQDPVVRVPALFIAGDRDLAVAHLGRAEVERRMRPQVPDLRHIEWVEDAGRWIQQECPAACNRVLLEFLAGL